MANTPQAKKRIRRNNRRAEINTARVSRIRGFVKKAMSLLEPVVILAMGIVIGFVVISMLMAIFSMNDLPF